ncbi:MAG: hypothetical protein VKK04_06720 [Synechococcales bacterium]|nr:hypothetical protein [Synechococcales bacterium]
MNTTQAFAPTAIECPKCGKHTVVLHAPDLYQCLNCDFRRDLSKDNGDSSKEKDKEKEKEQPNALLAIALAIATLLLLL